MSFDVIGDVPMLSAGRISSEQNFLNRNTTLEFVLVVVVVVVVEERLTVNWT